ncbi:MAG: tetratricopeptide repeat protein [Longimicrobiaceae bacterium]
MKPLRSAAPGARSRAPRSLPPPVHLDAAEGADLLGELSGAPGVLLWGALRDFMLWVETPAGTRGGLFAPGAGELRRRELAAHAPDPELWAPLLTLAQMADAPERADCARLVYAVRAIARWAERAGAPATRLAFTRAAALALPQEPGLALEAGRLARDLGRAPEGEAWLRNAVRRARGTNWETYVWAFIGLGVLYVRSGNYLGAQTVFGRALRSARKRRLRSLEGSSLHHLFTCAAESHDIARAYGYALAALAAYGPGHARIPALANDLARLWMHLERCDRALPVFAALMPLLTDPVERMIGEVNLARAAAGCGNRTVYERARAEALERMAAVPAGTRVAEAWALVASADAAAGEWERMEEAAQRAFELANERGEAEARVMADAQLEAACNRIPSPTEHWADETAASAAEGGRLAGELIVRMREMEPVGA